MWIENKKELSAKINAALTKGNGSKWVVAEGLWVLVNEGTWNRI